MLDKILNFFRKSTSYQQAKKDICVVGDDNATEEHERCVICGKLTYIPISMPIDLRENYETGLGQICGKCAKKLQNQRWTTSDSKYLLNVIHSSKDNK